LIPRIRWRRYSPYGQDGSSGSSLVIENSVLGEGVKPIFIIRKEKSLINGK